MSWIADAFYYLIPFLVLLGVLVFVHELGHFIVARLCGVKVEEFSIGFGKEIWGFNDKKGTRWKIAMIPLGGFVKMFGDGDASSSTADETAKELSDEDKKHSFIYQPPSKKLMIALSGPLANYLFAILVFASVFFFVGRVQFPAIIGGVIEGGAAAEAGVMPKDRVLKLNGIKIDTFADLQREVEMVVGGTAHLEIERDGKIITLPVKLRPIEIEENGEEKKKVLLGVRSITVSMCDYKGMPLWEALTAAVDETWTMTTTTLRGVGQMVTGQRSGKDVGGVIRIAEMTGDISKQHSVVNFLMFMALLSINLGLINLFPIPVLDGGQVVISFVEMVIRRELNDKVKEYMFRVGLALILALLIFATWNDLAHLFDRLFVKD